MTTSFAQGLTRQQKEVLTKELIKCDEIDSTNKVLLKTIVKDSILIADGRSVQSQQAIKINEYKNVIVPTLVAKDSVNTRDKNLYKKQLTNKNFWSIVKDIGIVGLLYALGVQAAKH